MSLINDIRSAQVAAAEDAIIKNLLGEKGE